MSTRFSLLRGIELITQVTIFGVLSLCAAFITILGVLQMQWQPLPPLEVLPEAALTGVLLYYTARVWWLPYALETHHAHLRIERLSGPLQIPYPALTALRKETVNGTPWLMLEYRDGDHLHTLRFNPYRVDIPHLAELLHAQRPDLEIAVG